MSHESETVDVDLTDGVLARLNDEHPSKHPAEIVTDALLLWEATDNPDDALAHGRAIGEVPGDG